MFYSGGFLSPSNKSIWIPGLLVVLCIKRYMTSSKKVQMRNKAIFISGCDSGFGFSLALHCQDSLGLQVIAGCYDPEGEDSGARLLREQRNISVVHLDVTSDESIEKAKSETARILAETDAELWCVVNNAAVLVFAEAEWQTRRMVSHQLDVNVVGALAMTKAFLPMLRASQGRVVNMVSFCTDCPLPTLSVYTASKAALRSLSAGMRMELAKFKVDVILFNPGDHPQETPLCSNQERHYKEMQQEVERIEDYDAIRKYFAECREKFSGLFPQPPVRKLENAGLYKIFTEIVTVERPRVEYVNSDHGTKAFFAVLRAMPTSWSDYARIGLMKLPKFK